MYHMVLLAFDGSVEGRVALSEGARLAQLCKSKVFLLSVASMTPGMEVAEAAYSGLADHQVAEYEAILGEGVKRLQGLGFEPGSRLTYGDAAEQIVAVADEIGADLVVMGHRKRGPLARWWSASVGGRVIEEVACSVLIGRQDVGEDIPPI